MELNDVPGLGPAKVAKLNEMGIKTAVQLAQMDLRKPVEAGISKDVLRKAKQSARKMLDQEGIAYEKAPYGDAKPAKKAASTSARTTTAPKPAAKPVVQPAAKPIARTAPSVSMTERSASNGAQKRGFFARIFKRA